VAALQERKGVMGKEEDRIPTWRQSHRAGSVGLSRRKAYGRQSGNKGTEGGLISRRKIKRAFFYAQSMPRVAMGREKGIKKGVR